MASNQCTHPTEPSIGGAKSLGHPIRWIRWWGTGVPTWAPDGLTVLVFFRVPGAIGLAAVVDRIINEEDGGDSFQP